MYAGCSPPVEATGHAGAEPTTHAPHDEPDRKEPLVSRRSELLDFAILGLLHEGPSHGYDLRRRLNSALGPFRALSYGSLYPALKGLLTRGLIAQSGEAATPSARPRISYELTADGKEAFEELVSRAGADTADDDTFEVRMAFFARTESEVRRLILEGRRHQLQARLDAARADRARRRDRADQWSSALARHGEESAEREVRWLSELIDAERRHPQDPGPQP